MRPETNLKEKLKMYRSLILFGLLIFYGLQNIPMLWNIFMRILSILTPFFIGGGFAFVLNILVNKIEELLGYTSLRQSLKRTISVIGALLVFFLVIACLSSFRTFRHRSRISSGRCRAQPMILSIG